MDLKIRLIYIANKKYLDKRDFYLSVLIVAKLRLTVIKKDIMQIVSNEYS